MTTSSAILPPEIVWYTGSTSADVALKREINPSVKLRISSRPSNLPWAYQQRVHSRTIFLTEHADNIINRPQTERMNAKSDVFFDISYRIMM